MDEGDLAKALADRSIVGCWPSRWKVSPAATCFYEDTNKYHEGSRIRFSGRLAQACACFQQIRLCNECDCRVKLRRLRERCGILKKRKQLQITGEKN